jgi:hypothetical protein
MDQDMSCNCWIEFSKTEMERGGVMKRCYEAREQEGKLLSVPHWFLNLCRILACRCSSSYQTNLIEQDNKNAEILYPLCDRQKQATYCAYFGSEISWLLFMRDFE